jgi:hypothetical protein
MNTKKRASRKINTHRLGRASGLSRWYSFPLHRIETESQTAVVPNMTSRRSSRWLWTRVAQTPACFALY